MLPFMLPNFFHSTQCFFQEVTYTSSCGVWTRLGILKFEAKHQKSKHYNLVKWISTSKQLFFNNANYLIFNTVQKKLKNGMIGDDMIYSNKNHNTISIAKGVTLKKTLRKLVCRYLFVEVD